MLTGQLFSRTTQALFYNYKHSPVQRMLDFDFLCGREIPSVAGIINPGSEGFQKLFFGQEEIAVPVHGRYVYILSKLMVFSLAASEICELKGTVTSINELFAGLLVEWRLEHLKLFS
jgi:hypothetical protein